VHERAGELRLADEAFHSTCIGNAILQEKLQCDTATELRVALKPLPPGTYKVIWRVLSVDTHRTNGSFIFRVGP